MSGLYLPDDSGCDSRNVFRLCQMLPRVDGGTNPHWIPLLLGAWGTSISLNISLLG